MGLDSVYRIPNNGIKPFERDGKRNRSETRLAGKSETLHEVLVGDAAARRRAADPSAPITPLREVLRPTDPDKAYALQPCTTQH